MKSKKFFILALAAAVLFAFAACQPGSVSYTDLNRIEIEQTGTILVGQDPKDTDFTVTGYFNNEGTPVKATITYLDATDDTTAVEKDVAVRAKATVTASSFGKDIILTDIVSITKTDITSLEFSGAETAFTFEQTAESAAKIKAAAESLASDKYTVTANGSVAIDASVYADVKAGITTEDGNIFDTAEDRDAVITALLDEANLGKTLPVVLQITAGGKDMTATTNVTITMTEEVADPVFDHYELKLLNETWLGENISWEVVAIDSADNVMSSGKVGSSEFNDFFQIVSGTIPTEYGANDVTVKALKIDGANKGAEVTMVFPEGDDYIVAAPTITVKSGYTFAKDSPVTKSGFEAKAKWASDPETAVDFAGTWDVATDYTVTGESQDIYFNLVWDNKGVDKPEFIKVTINGD